MFLKYSKENLTIREIKIILDRYKRGGKSDLVDLSNFFVIYVGMFINLMSLPNFPRDPGSQFFACLRGEWYAISILF